MKMRARLVKIKGGGALRALEIGLMMVAVASLTAFGLMEFEKFRGQAQLRSEFDRAVETSSAAPRQEIPAELPGESDVPSDRPAPVLGAALGRLKSERIGLDVMIAEGVDNATLRRAAGRIPGTAPLGAGGNVGLAAHRDTFFRPLREVRKGDELELETVRGRTRYRVDWTAVVEPNNVDPLAQTSEDALTLVTCFPFHYVGPAPRRFIVRASKVAGDGADIAAATR